MSADPDRRLRALGVHRLRGRVVHRIPAADPRTLERVLHQAFAHRLLFREWFKLDAAEVGMIRSIRSADTLPGDLLALLDNPPERDKSLPRALPAGVKVADQVYAPADLVRAIDAYRAAQNPPITRSEFANAALREFLKARGHWPPPASGSPPGS